MVRQAVGNAAGGSEGFVAGAASRRPYPQGPLAAARAGLAVLKREPERVARLTDNADFLRDGLRELGYDTGHSETPIVPVILNDERTAALMAGRLREMGVAVSPILFPAVPLGSARLRLCATAAHSIEDLEFALNAFREIR